jgi:ribonuclease HI
METAFRIYTDGGCSGNPGPGGWAYVMVLNTFQGEKTIAQNHGAQENTTNNKMELTAVIEALKAYREMNDAPKNACLFTDSQYVQKGITEWINQWKRNSWRTSDKKPVKNQDLWQALDSLNSELKVEWKWVKGHAGNKYNELCDQLTQTAIATLC